MFLFPLRTKTTPRFPPPPPLVTAPPKTLTRQRRTLVEPTLVAALRILLVRRLTTRALLLPPSPPPSAPVTIPLLPHTRLPKCPELTISGWVILLPLMTAKRQVGALKKLPLLKRRSPQNPIGLRWNRILAVGPSRNGPLPPQVTTRTVTRLTLPKVL